MLCYIYQKEVKSGGCFYEACRVCLCILTVLMLIFGALPMGISAETSPSISTKKTEYILSDTVKINFEGTDSKDWVGVYPDGAEPGGMNSIIWKYAVGTGTVSFAASSFGGPGDYAIYLCDNDGYAILDVLFVTILDNDPTDYGAKDATVSAVVENGMSKTSVTIVPGSDQELTYKLYWSAGEKRLTGYRPIAAVTHA